MTEYAICCDWGSSSLRIRLVWASSGEVVDQEVSDEGITVIHQEWQTQLAQEAKSNRVQFYLSYLHTRLLKIATRMQLDLEGTPIIISGMASSNIGFIELPYAEVPFNLNGSSAMIKYLAPTSTFNYPLTLISGLKTGNEVMRGEETQLIGLGVHWPNLHQADQLIIILPGTHSKHVRLSKGNILSFNTFITGELFDILSHHGMLKDAVELTDHLAIYWPAFDEGIRAAMHTEILQSLFQVRTNALLGKFNKSQNSAYLSGLLIGYELKGLLKRDFSKILLCCESKLFAYYKQAIEVLGLQDLAQFVNPPDAEKATVSGQLTATYPSLSF